MDVVGDESALGEAYVFRGGLADMDLQQVISLLLTGAAVQWALSPIQRAKGVQHL